MIFPASLLPTFLKTIPSKNLPHSNIPNTTLTPPNPAPTASSTSTIRSPQPTYQYISGIVNSPTAPFITATRACWISLAMTSQNPLALPFTEDPLPPLSSICLLKSSPWHSQPPLTHTLGYLDPLLLLPMLQYPQDLQPLPTTFSPSDRCHLTQSAPPSPATTSQPTPTAPLSTGWLLPQKHAHTTSSKTSLPKKQTTKRSWMTVTRRLSSWKPASSGTLTPSPSLPRDTSRMVTSPCSPSPVATDSQTPPNGSRSWTTAGSLAIQCRMALTTSPTSAKYMPPPNIQLTLQSLYPIGSTRPFKGQPLAMLPSLMRSRLRTIGGSRPTSYNSETLMNASSPTKPSSTAPMGSSRAPSSPETNAEATWNVRDFLSGFCIWQKN